MNTHKYHAEDIIATKERAGRIHIFPRDGIPYPFWEMILTSCDWRMMSHVRETNFSSQDEYLDHIYRLIEKRYTVTNGRLTLSMIHRFKIQSYIEKLLSTKY